MQDLEAYVQKAIRSLRNFFFYLKVKKYRERNFHLHRISFAKGYSLYSYTIKFPSDAKNQVRMIYSLQYKEYYAEVWLKQNTEFLITSNKVPIILPNYPTKLSAEGKIVNYVKNAMIDRLLISRMILKKKPKLTQNFEFSSHCKSIGKTPDTNEDAYFLTSSVIGVADGVGGLFSQFGISSKDFSNELMQKCKEISTQNNSSFLPKEIAEKALKSMTNGGSSTYLIAKIIRNRLIISNMGDCGLLIYRSKGNSMKLMFQTTAKQHAFNTPFQVSKEFSPKQLISRSRYFINKTLKNAFDNIDSDEYSITIHDGDLIVIGSDGLFDNLFTEEITKIIKKCNDVCDVEDITHKIFSMAVKRSDRFEETPFESRMKKENMNWKGGKKDDITVIASLIKKSNAKVFDNY